MEKDYLKRLNSEQLNYLDLNSNVLVSASAGTGKTSTMVTKLLTLIVERKIPVKKLLVVTFTNAAAWEMKQRLLVQLNKYITECGEDEKDFIQDQIEDMGNCDIGTIHSICRKWIIKYFNVLNLDPSFGLLDETQSKFYYNSAIKKVFNKFVLEKNFDFFELFLAFNKSRDEETLKEVVFKINAFMCTKINHEEWERFVLEDCCNIDVNENKCCLYLKNYICENVGKYKQEFEKMLNIAENYGFEKFIMFCKNRLVFIDEILNSSDFVDLSKKFLLFNFIRKPSVKSGQGSVDLDEYNDNLAVLNKAFNDFKTDIKEVLADYGDGDWQNGFVNEMQFMKKNLKALFDLWKKVFDEYAKIKSNKNVLDFNDIEHYAYELISNPAVLEQLKNSYDFVFIDEYQDVNEIQEKILTSLERNNNLNMIGDVKQSIYAFRRSTPKIFIEKYNRFINNDGGSVSYFNRNYRSDNNILQFVNSIFNELITLKTIGIDYKKDSQLISGFDQKGCDAVSIKLVNLNIETEDEEEIVLNKEEIISKQCSLIVDHIASLIGKKYKTGDKEAYYTYKDIAILLRSKGAFLNELVKTLKRYNIPVSAKYKLQIFKELEITYLLSVLKIVDNPYDDIALVTLMKGVIGGFDENELMEISQIEGECFYNKIVNYSNDDQIKEKISDLMCKLENYRFYFKAHDLKGLVNKIINENDLLLYFKSLPNGFQREANIQEFIKLASSPVYAKSIFDFLNYVDLIKENNYELNINSGNNCVQIMTMHGSKGLGYPAVIIADMGTNFKINKNTSECVLNDELGVGVKFKDVKARTQKNSINQNACLVANKVSELNEEIRIFYVALTRAKNDLFLIGGYNLNSLNNKITKNVYDCKSFFDFYFYSLPDVDLEYFKNKKANFILNPETEFRASVEIIDCINQEDEKENKKPIMIQEVENKILEDNIKIIEDRLNQDKKLGVVKKNTVSGLLIENKDYELELDVFNKLSLYDCNEKFNEAAELGTLYHKIMENLKYDEGLEDIIKIVNSYVSDLDNEVADKVDYNKVYKALVDVKKLINPTSKILKEQQFVMKVPHNEVIKESSVNDKIIVQGVIDMVIINSDNTGYIIDFKSNKSKNAEYYAKHYKTQLFLYKLAMKRKFNGVDFKTLIYSFEAGKMFEI